MRRIDSSLTTEPNVNLPEYLMRYILKSSSLYLGELGESRAKYQLRMNKSLESNKCYIRFSPFTRKLVIIAYIPPNSMRSFPTFHRIDLIDLMSATKYEMGKFIFQIEKYLIQQESNPMRVNTVKLTTDDVDMINKMLNEDVIKELFKITPQQCFDAATYDDVIVVGAYIVQNKGNHAALEVKDDVMHCTPLMGASMQGNARIVKLLLQAGANVDAVNERDRTALWFAIGRQCLDVVNLLIEYCAEVNKMTTSGETLLMCALRCGDINIVKALYEAGADINAVDSMNEYSVLMRSVQYGRIEMLKYFLENEKLNIAWQNTHGDDALTFAKIRNNSEMVKLISEELARREFAASHVIEDISSVISEFDFAVLNSATKVSTDLPASIFVSAAAAPDEMTMPAYENSLPGIRMFSDSASRTVSLSQDQNVESFNPRLS